MKLLKYNSLILSIYFICLASTISIQSQTLYWQQITPAYFVYDMLYDGQQNLYFTGSSGNWFFWRSSDLGLTWTRTGSGSLRLYKLALDSNGVLWSGNDFYGGIYKSTNQGDTWINTFPTSDKIFPVTVSPNNFIWTGTLDGKVIYSSNSGETWITNTIDNDNIWAIASNSLNHIFVGSMSSKIFRTTDLGATWELVCTTTLGIWDIVIDDQDIIYVTAWGKRLISYDNGNTWTTIGGPVLECLYLDKYHNFYAGPNYRSLDNCVSWQFMGNANTYAYAFIDSLVFAGTGYGVYLYDPSYQPYIGDNYFPLALGNKWQFHKECDNSSSGENSIYYVDKDTTIENEKYYLLQGSINDWVRYDNEEHKLFIRISINNHEYDYVNMDYSLNAASSLTQLTFNTHEFRTVYIRPPTYISIFDSSYHSKGYSWSIQYPMGGAGYSYYYSESIGETKRTYDYGGPGGTWDYCLTKMIRAILHDSTDVKYYTDHVKPAINFQPVFVTNEFELNWNFTVDHEYTHFGGNWNENFVDSVIMYSYYSNEDSTFLNQPVLAANEPNSIDYSISYLLDSTLMKNDYSFYYKIYAVDKGIVPEYSTKPDIGYYELVYDPTVSAETIENNIVDYELKQNYPNPFNPVTVIEYSVKEEGDVELVIYDVLGRVVEKLVDERKTAGNYSTQFEASHLSSGIYFYSLRVNDFVSTKKMLLLK